MIAEKIKASLTGKKVFERGVHPDDFKSASSEVPISVITPPDHILIPLQQHIGAPAQPIVKVRDEVEIGTKIAEPGGFVSAAIYSSVKGKVAAATTTLVASGQRVAAMPINVDHSADGQMETLLREYLSVDDNARDVEQIEPDEIVNAVADAGIVGMGGATFPTHVKLKVKPDTHIDTFILNGCECEPFLTADDRLMREGSQAVVRGFALAMRAVNAKRGIIAIEDNKPQAIEAMRQTSAQFANMEVVVCMTKYPMGGERQLIWTTLRRAVPTGGLPLDVGVIVMNVGTSAALANAVDRKRPLTHRIVTVTGAVKQSGNFFVPIGTPISYLIEQAGGLREDAAEVIMGGPMMGVSMPDLTVPAIKGTSGITVLSKSQVKAREEASCIRCGRCVDHCPLHLMPTKIAHAVKFRDIELAQHYDMTACIECGCCSYVCPAGIPLVQYIKSGKAMFMRMKKFNN